MTDPTAGMDKELERLERAMDSADASIGADRRAITQSAQLDAAEAVAMTGIAMESDEEAAEAYRLSILASRNGKSEEAKRAAAKERSARKKAKADHKAATKSARKAYDAIRFSDPSSLGFLRVIQVFLAINIVGTCLALSVTAKGSLAMTPLQIWSLLDVVLNGVSFWLIMKRKALARTWVISVNALDIALGVVFGIISSYDFLSILASEATSIFMVLYFAFSKRVKASLVNPFNTRTFNDDLDEDESFFQPKTWAFWRNLLIYFVVFSIVGHWMEAGVCLLIKYGIVPGTYDPTSQIWSDWLYPFPVYGIGFCACALLLYPLKNFLQRKIQGPMIISLLVSFIANALVCTIIEFTMGMFVNADLQLWDYSNMFGNFMGQVCLQNALFFGLVATIMTWVVYPALEKLFRRVPVESMTVVFVIVMVGFAILIALYYITLPQSVSL